MGEKSWEVMLSMDQVILYTTGSTSLVCFGGFLFLTFRLIRLGEVLSHLTDEVERYEDSSHKLLERMKQLQKESSSSHEVEPAINSPQKHSLSDEDIPDEFLKEKEKKKEKEITRELSSFVSLDESPDREQPEPETQEFPASAREDVLNDSERKKFQKQSDQNGLLSMEPEDENNEDSEDDASISDLDEMEVEVFSNKTGTTQIIKKSEIMNDSDTASENNENGKAKPSWSATGESSEEEEEMEDMSLKTWNPRLVNQMPSGKASPNTGSSIQKTAVSKPESSTRGAGDFQELRKTTALPEQSLGTSPVQNDYQEVVPDFIGLNQRSMVVFLFNKQEQAADLSRLDEAIEFMNKVDVVVLDFFSVQYLLPNEVENMKLSVAKMRAFPTRILLSNCNQKLQYQMEKAGVSSDLEFLL